MHVHNPLEGLSEIESAEKGENQHVYEERCYKYGQLLHCVQDICELLAHLAHEYHSNNRAYPVG